MTRMTSTIRKPVLLSGAATGALLLALSAAPAFAQDQAQAGATAATSAAPVNPQAQAADQSDQGGDIVVTGTLFRRLNTETASPITVLTSENLQRAGITNVADAIRSISADNSGSIPTAFANGFGSGSAAVSLRGLTVNSTLVLIDGVRTANYPFADDGQRAFVDLNSIPRSTIDRIEVLKDGASATYGADAIGGVVNIITRKEIKGIEGTVEAGVSQRGDGGERRATLTAGYGDLKEQGFNVYINGEYEKNNLISVADRGFPYNTTDLTSIGGLNNNVGAFGGFGTRIGTTSAVVQPATYTPGNILSGVRVPNSLTQVLNPAGCGLGTIARNDATTVENGGNGGAYCEQNQAQYGTIAPRQERYGATLHGALQLGDRGQAYFTGTYYHSSVFSTGTPFSIRQSNPVNTRSIVLPALLSNGQLNPQNPYAASGLGAQISYGFGDLPVTSTTDNDLYRAAVGAAGKFGDDWSYSVDASYARSELLGTNTGYINIAGLTNAINTGSYNFINPSLNSQAVRDQVSPVVKSTATSQLYLLQGSLSKSFFELPGGPLQIGIGGQVRREELNNPNANVGNAFLGLNAVTASGKRTIAAGYFEISAPVLKSVELGAAGRYDHYSDGYGRFSPKASIKFTPFRQLALRGTFSKGFRAPSFAENQVGSVVGYTTTVPPASVVAAHNNNAYVQSYAFGYNTASNPNLKPEKSTSFTAGAVFQPTRWLSATVDYYNIRKTDVISGGPNAGDAVAAYYAGNPIPAGYSVTLDDADPAFPNAIRKVLIVNSLYANAASLKTSGLDVSIQADFKFGGDKRFTSRLEGTEIFQYDFNSGDGTGIIDSYVGTQAPYVLSSGAGTPRWRANWMNSMQVGAATLTATAYYTSGYKNVAVDQSGHGANTCADNLYGTGDTFCRTKGFFTLDLVGQFKVNDKFTFYLNAVNLLDASAPINPANYAAVNYNPTWTQQGIVGRTIRGGANFKF